MHIQGISITVIVNLESLLQRNRQRIADCYDSSLRFAAFGMTLRETSHGITVQKSK